MICDESWKIHDASFITEINNKSFEINDLKAQLQEKLIVVNELKQLLAKLEGKSQVTSCETPNLDSRIQKLNDENVSLAFQVSSLEKEREHLKIVYKNLYDSINLTRAQNKLKTDSLQQKLNDQISKNAKLRAQLQAKFFESQKNQQAALWFHSPSSSCKTHTNMEDKKKDKGKAIIHLLEYPTSHGGVNEKSLIHATSGPSDVLPDLGPFGNVFDLPDGGAIDGNTVVNEFLSKPSWTSQHTNMAGVTSKVQGYTAYPIDVPQINPAQLPLQRELIYNNLFGDLTRVKELETNLELKKVGLRRDLEWVMRKAIPRMLTKVLRSEQFDNEMLKVQKVLLDRGRDLGRQKDRNLLMSNQRVLAFDPNLSRKTKDVVRGLKKIKWECMETVLSSPDLSPNLLRGVLDRGDSSVGEGSSS
ncbi:hypothetical protein Tco_1500979 [Tanacetum coccineum]